MSPAIEFVSKSKGRLTLVAVLLIALASAVGAIAYWTTSGTGTGNASSGNLTAPGKPNVPTTGAAVNLSWTAGTVSGGGTVLYHVERRDEPGSTWTDVCGSSDAAPIAGLSCSDTPGSGSFVYRVTSRYATWHTTGAESDPVAAVVALDHFTVTPATGTQTSGASFSVTVTAKDASNITIPSYVGTIQFTSNDGQALLPADYTFLGGDNGSHTFTNGVTLNTAGAGKTVTVTDSGKTGTATYTVEPGAAAQIVLSGSESDLASGAARTFTATVQDTAGNTVTTGADSTVSVSFAQISGAGSVSGTGSTAATAGVATINLTGDLAGSVTVRASGSLSGPGPSVSNTLTFNVTQGAASQIALSGAVTDLASGSSRTFTATVQDAAGNTITTGADSTVSVSFDQTAGTGSVSGTGAANAVAGVATKSISGNLAGTVTIRANASLSGPGATNSNTLSFDVTHGSASQIVLSAPTSDLASGATRALTATIKDAAGNTVTTGVDATSSVTFSKTAGAGTVSGLTASTAVAGVASLTVTGNLVGSITLQASATLTVGATNSNTLTFNVVAGAASQILLAGAVTDLASGSSRAFTATVRDAAGNTVTTGADSTVSVNFAQTAGTGSVSGTGAATAAAGVATKNLTGNLTGTVTVAASASLSGPGATNSNSLSFNVVHGAASQITLSGASTDLASGATRLLTATIKDAAGNTVTTGLDATRSVTFAKTTGAGTVTGLAASTAVAGVANLTVTGNLVGSITLQASATLTVGLTNSNTLIFNVVAGAATKLSFSTQPSGSTGGTAFTTQPAVTVQDAAGNTVTGDTSNVTLAITAGTGTAGAALTCTANPTNAVSGIATFAGCKIDKAGTGYTLTATDGALTSAVSNSITITVGPATQVTFTQQPGNGTGGSAFSTQPLVTVKDAGGNLVSGSAVTLAITGGTGTAGAALSCTANPVNTNGSGIATFAGCKIDKTGSGYTLTATAGTGTATSTTFNVTAGAAAGLIYTNATNKNGSITPIHNISNVTAVTCTALGLTSGNGRFFTARLTLIDAGGNVVTNGGSAITITLSQTGATNVTPATVSIANGASASGGTFTMQQPNGSSTGTVTAAATVSAVAVTSVCQAN